MASLTEYPTESQQSKLPRAKQIQRQEIREQLDSIVDMLLESKLVSEDDARKFMPNNFHRRARALRSE